MKNELSVPAQHPHLWKVRLIRNPHIRAIVKAQFAFEAYQKAGLIDNHVLVSYVEVECTPCFTRSGKLLLPAGNLST
jgi:hypothetical protein